MATSDWWNPVPYLSRKADEHARKLNFIWKMIIDPCDAPLTVWAWTFWPAFGHLVLGILALDVKQMFRSYLKPQFRAGKARGLAHWHGGEKGKRKGGKGGRFRFPDFDYNDWLGKDLLGTNKYGGFAAFPGELEIWSIVDVFERLAFYFMVFDFGVGFFYEWASAVAQTKYCHARDDAVLLASAPGYPLLGIFGWDAVGILDAQKMRKVRFFNGFGASLEFGPGQAAISAVGRHTGGDPDPWIEIRIRCLTGPRAGYTTGERADVVGMGSAQVGAQCVINGDEVWIGEIRVNGSWFIDAPTLNMHAVAKVPFQ